MSAEVSHYVVTAHPPGAVLLTASCSFLSADSKDVIVAKSGRLEVRQACQDDNSSSPFPVVLTLPIHGRITTMVPIRLKDETTDYLFLTTDRYRYAVISYSPESTPYPVKTLASGSLKTTGREPAVGPIAAVHASCLALHLYDGILTCIPIHTDYKPGASKGRSFAGQHSLLGEPYQVRLEERALLDMVFLDTPSPEKEPHLAILHQDSRNAQHVCTYALNVRKKQLTVAWKKSRVDGGSSMLLAVAGNGGVVVVGQRQITYLNTGMSKVVPLPSCLLTSWTSLTSGKWLLGDEFGNLHILTLAATRMELETLGSCNISSALEHIGNGLVFVASSFGDSQLVQIHSEPLQPVHHDNEHMEASTFLEIVQEYTNLGPIVDFDLVPTHAQQSQVITCSGSSTSGSLRLIRNGIGMNECASVEMEGIQHMWSVRKSFGDKQDAYLVQSFVGETRVLGVSISEEDDAMKDDDDDEEGGTLEEVVLQGLDSSASSLYVGNVQVGDTILQITEAQVRLLSASSMEVTATWTPDGDDQAITAAAANEAGQIAVSLRGGMLLYLRVKDISTIELVHQSKLPSEVSSVDLNPFVASDADSAMDVDATFASSLLAVGLWEDFTVRLLSLESNLDELLSISLSTEDEEEADPVEGASSSRTTRTKMVAGSLCLITLDSANAASSSGSVNMLFVGLGDGTVLSFAIVERDGRLTANSRKEVSLGTQRIDLVPLQTEQGGRCVLATGDRPTVIYLAGGRGAGAGGAFSNPKLCYSNVNLSTSEAGDEDEEDVNRPPAQQSIAVNVATPFVSPELFDVSSAGSKHFSLCVSDDSNLRLGVIDDIQKLHVTTCRLGMAPRRVVHCSDDRMFAVGCIESGLTQGGGVRDDVNMGNCIRFLDDTTFDDIHSIDLEPFEMILSMAYVNLGPAESVAGDDLNGLGESDAGNGEAKPYLLVGTGYALPDEDEPTRGRIIVLSCFSGGLEGSSRGVRHVTELQVKGGVYSICQFYDHKILATVNTKTQVCQLADDGTGMVKLSFVGIGHHGHVLSLLVKSKAKRETAAKSKDPKEDDTMMEDTPMKKTPQNGSETPDEQLAIVGDLMRSISLVQYYPEHKALEEIARDFNANWTTAVEMLTENVYLGAENWNNIFVLRRNVKAQSEEVRCRLDTIGEFHLGEMCNKFMCGSLVMPHSNSSSTGRRKVALRMTSPVKGGGREGNPAASTKAFRPTVTIGTQTLYATVDGTLGAILGLDARTAAFFKTLERAMAKTITPIGNFGHAEYRAFDAERRVHPSHGFVDGDMVESFLDLDRDSMEMVVKEVNRDGGWDIDSFTLRRNQHGDDEDEDGEDLENQLALTVEDVLAMVEEMTMFH